MYEAKGIITLIECSTTQDGKAFLIFLHYEFSDDG